MNTSYIRFVQQYDDPVWGTQALPWVQTSLVRVTRNRLNRAVFEWVGNPGEQVDLEYMKRNYPIAMFADLPNSGSEMHSYRKTAPLPKWVASASPAPNSPVSGM